MEESKQILMAVTELQANMKNMSDQLKEISKIGHAVIETTQSVKSAHMRIDDLKTEFSQKLQNQKDDYEQKISDLKIDVETKAKEQKEHIETKTKEQKEHIETKTKSQKEDFEAKLKDQKEDHLDLKSSMTWLWRTVVSGGIGAAFGLAVFFITRG
jgi:hypothetical protein